MKTIAIGGFAAAVAATVAAGIAFASIPDAAGVIHGCYSKPFGLLRVIDPAAGQSCHKWETTLDWGQQGPPGPQGAPGPQGPQGAPGISGYQVVVTQAQPTILGGASNTVEADCPQGKNVLGGGGSSTLSGQELHLQTSAPNGTNTGWLAEFANMTANPQQAFLWVYAICATLAP